MIIPDDALVVLCGPAGCGKSTFARRHFRETEIVSSDHCRALVGDDEGDQAVNGPAFLLLRTLIRLRLRLRRLTVVDSTAVQAAQRRSLLRLGRAHEAPVIAVLLDIDAETCKARNRGRQRQVPEDVIDLHRAQFVETLQQVFAEGFDTVYILADPDREPVERGGRQV